MSIHSLKLASLGLTSALVLMAAAPQSMAQSQTANLSDAERRCLAEASRVKRDYIRHFGGDHVFYDFEYRSTEAAALCKHGDTDEAWDLMAEIKSDIRTLRNKEGGRFRSN